MDLLLSFLQSEQQRKDLQASYAATADRIEAVMAAEKRKSAEATSDLKGKIDKLKQRVAASKQEVESVRAEAARAEGEHTKALQQMQQSMMASHQRAIEEVEKRLHAQYEALLSQRLDDAKRGSEEESRYRRLVETELEAVKSSCITRTEHQRLCDLLCKEAAKDATQRVEAEAARRLQSAVEDANRRQTDDVRILRGQLQDGEDKLLREQAAKRDAESKLVRVERYSPFLS